MNSERVGRNDPCPCGSGINYKKCCLSKAHRQAPPPAEDDVDRQIRDAAMLSLEHSQSAIMEAIATLEGLHANQQLNQSQKQNVTLQLAQAYQRRGQHRAALDLLRPLLQDPSVTETPTSELSVKMAMAVSLNALGPNPEACRLFDEVLAALGTPAGDPKMLAMASIEAGKAYSQGGNGARARECWETALAYCEGREEEREHLARVKANLGFLLLHDPDDAKQEEGVRIIEASSDMKRQIGDLDGLANNNCNLGLYYWRKKRYQRAISHTRMDLVLSRRVGNLRSVAATLGNLAGIYVDMKQFSKARVALKEAEQIGEDLNDDQLVAISKHGLRRVDEAGRKAGQDGEKIGPSAACACGSGKGYQDCCGLADFEPIDLPMAFGGISEELDQVVEEMKATGVEPSRLDFILREPRQSANPRLGWCRVHVHDGWMEMHELPDMANYHLVSAKSLAEEARETPDLVAKPLSCILLSACAAEAFINQVAFFLHEVQGLAEGRFHTVPSELSADVMAFQRGTELTQKWDILGNALCGRYWPPPADLWRAFRNLVYIRNELVHFKVAGYEQVVPPPREAHEVIKRLPKDLVPKQSTHAWPMRVLTPAVASWSVSVVERMISHFRHGYADSRRETKED